MRRRFLILHNPTAGSFRSRGRLDSVIACLRQHACHVDVWTSDSPGDARRAAGQAATLGECDALIVAGGDGTVRAAATALVGTSMPLGIIPLGTGNVLAHEIGLTFKAHAIADCLMRGRTIVVRTASVNGEPFFLMVGAGFDGRVITKLNATWKRRLGKLAYVSPVTKALLADRDQLRVRVDGVEYTAVWAIATLRRRYAGSFVLVHEARIEDEDIHVVILKPRNRLALAGQLISMAIGSVGSRMDVAKYSGGTIEITSEVPVPVQVDGEPFGMTPVQITMGGPALKLIVPCEP